ncbi:MULTISPECIES: SDR family oxidoreductase [unclassified Chelatococcus]|uniref:SDR family oxidoreductase n=1 Tax=unclassified Chelatococcus TaxID=2638111 RepID=UPI001BCCBE21|nr:MULTISPECIES: SDR family oxidoreductase [unclassified Chelatococcus]CAH1652289.1 NAD(P)-dependent dehydrogenase (Short-subunit alcohol dehydrogenase family) [Hyphomicrobiales bacterium]MBS7743054.1 SDR family oxidoreductase [Chelatococcus sp. HY11]MBX3541828.1 SDR family oxidoreductase [Chelatococcus sp.]MCO5074281.1 SDR family oxidoreductase [Chelatococcus sp.]CAH1693763.1 NAD(P)-dependent dehydrogenase (Short-subunit alcohol dehydrogenase family) [Hyphomicrobiales bacterium]
MDLSGKTAIITAGAGGIGLAIARRFAKYGASVCICDIAEEALAAVASELPDALIVRADVSHASDVERLFEAFQKRFDRLDILVNNAGVSGPTKAVDEITDSEWQSTLDVNITGMFYMIRAAVPLFRAQHSGAVINMSSVAGRLGMPLRTPYSVSKYAVRGLTDVLAIELGEIGVRVNALLPGLVDGPRGQRVLAEQAEARGMDIAKYEKLFLHNISMHTKIQMDEIADMAAFLGSDLAPHISGQSISVCGNFESYRAPLVLGA